MKIYKFYRKHSGEALKESEDLDVTDKYPLYAFTNDKELRNEFKKTRDMTKFIECKSEIDTSEYLEYANSHSNQSLRKESLKSFNDYGKEPLILSVPVVCTWNELDYMADAMDNLLTDIEFSVYPFLFEEKYVKALRTLEYISYWKLYGQPEKYRGILGMNDDELDDMDYSAPATAMDELQVFLAVHGDLFKS
ncbi:MAG: hypothetical protein K2O54_01085 [Prevotella sp.]|nr:hypothetical protein [Prevotella sp.]